MKSTSIFLSIFFISLLWCSCSSDKAQMELTYSPADAVIEIDGFSPTSHKSPHVFDFYKGGTYKMDVSAPGYIPVTMRLEVKAGEVLKQSVHLVKDNGKNADDQKTGDSSQTPNVIATSEGADTEKQGPQQGAIDHDFTLSVATVPPGATVVVQTPRMRSVLVLNTPASQVLPRNAPWTLNVTLDGYETITQTVVAPVDQDELNLNFTMSKNAAGAAAQSPTNAVSNNSTPPQIAVESPQQPPTDDRIITHGLLSVSTTPWTVVSVDGKVIGNTPIRFHKLRPGKYNVLMENRDQAKRKIQSVIIPPGGHIRLEQEL